jgi:hypothetical protein
MQSYRDVIEAWPNRESLAEDAATTTEAVRKWWERNRIAPSYWLPVFNAAKSRGIDGVSLELLASLRTRR